MIIDLKAQNVCTYCLLYEFVCLFYNQWRMQWIYKCKFYNIFIYIFLVLAWKYFIKMRLSKIYCFCSYHPFPRHVSSANNITPEMRFIVIGKSFIRIIMEFSPSIFRGIRNVSDKSCRDFMFIYFKSCRYEIMWKNARPDRL